MRTFSWLFIVAVQFTRTSMSFRSALSDFVVAKARPFHALLSLESGASMGQLTCVCGSIIDSNHETRLSRTTVALSCYSRCRRLMVGHRRLPR